jgi:hypothetical protein
MTMDPITLITLLAEAGANVYTAIKGNASNAGLVNNLVALGVQVANSISKTNSVLTQAQAEGWTPNDKRWLPVFSEVHAAIAAAESAL